MDFLSMTYSATVAQRPKSIGVGFVRVRSPAVVDPDVPVPAAPLDGRRGHVVRQRATDDVAWPYVLQQRAEAVHDPKILEQREPLQVLRPGAVLGYDEIHLVNRAR